MTKREPMRGGGKVNPVARGDTISSLGLARPMGDFYVSGFSSDGRTALVPGAADAHRRLLLLYAAQLEPGLLSTLRKVNIDDEDALLAWAERWHLTNRWCVLLAHDTLRWWTKNPGTEGWEFEQTNIFPGFFPFPIAPLRFGPFYHDPTWRRRSDFIKYVVQQATKAAKDYCDQIEASALAAGLKCAPRRREPEHFNWLVRYQIKDESFASIAQHSSYKFNGGRQTIRKAIVELAEYLELSLRPSTSARTR